MESSILNEEDCEKILHRSTDFPCKLTSFRLCRFSEKLIGYMGDYFSLTIEYQALNERLKTLRKKRFFVKTLPVYNSNQLSYTNEIGVFRKERFLYDNLMNDLVKIFPFTARCYFTNENSIVLEDLTVKGYNNIRRMKYLEEEYCINLLQTLGKFHASTVIYEENRGVKLDAKFGRIEECCFNFSEGHSRQKWCVSTTKSVMDCIKLLMPTNSNSEEIARRLQTFVFEEMPILISPSKKFRNVLTHDDLWAGNMMFNSKLECVLVDFQMGRYVPPALDFLITLYLNLDSVYLNDNYDRLVDVYYRSLSEEIRKHKLDTQFLLGREEFEETLNHYKLAALTEAAMYGTHVFISEELGNRVISDLNTFQEFSFIDRSKYITEEFIENTQFNERMSGILFPLIQTLEDLTKLY